MDYTRKTVRSRPGLSAGEAVISLQSAPFYRPGTKIASLDQRADRWVAELHIPRTAAPFPPGGGDEGPPDEKSAPPSDDSPDDSPVPDSDGDSDGGPDEGGEKKPKSDKPGSDTEIVDLLTQILHALGGGAPMGGPDDLGPGLDGPPAPPPHGGPAGGPGGAPAPPKGPAGMGAGRPIKPGEIPNKPGAVPIGSPAFSSRQANPLEIPRGNGPAGFSGADVAGMGGGPLSPGPSPMHPGSGAPVPGPTSQGGTGACSGCGGPIGPDGSCPNCGSSYMASLRNHFAKVAGRSNHIKITAPDPQFGIGETVRAVRAVAEPHGYTVRQARRINGHATVLLTVR